MKFPALNKQTLKGAAALLAIAALTSSCSKDGNNNPLPGISKKNAKFTFSVKDINLADGDAAKVTITGSDGTIDGTIWKVNGVTRNNEPLVSFDEDELASGTEFVVETVKPVVNAQVSLVVVNFNGAVKLSYTPTVEGSSQQPVIETVSGDYNKVFSY